jgi:NAD(P)H-nitrite reductase large subunit
MTAPFGKELVSKGNCLGASCDDMEAYWNDIYSSENGQPILNKEATGKQLDKLKECLGQTGCAFANTEAKEIA